MAKNIEIGIKVKENGDIKALNDFENKVKSTATAEKQMAEATKQVDTASKKANQTLNQTSKTVDNVGKSANKTSKDMNSLAGSLKKEMGDSFKSLSGNFGIAGSKIGEFVSNLGFVRGGLAGFAVAAAVASKAAIDTADRIVDGADSIGISVGMYQKLDSELKKNGSSMDRFQGTILRIQSSIESASPAFDKLGVSIYDQNGNLRDQESIISDVIVALGKETDVVKRNTLAKELGGKSIRDLILLGNVWSNQKSPTLLTDSEIEKLKRASDLMDDIKQTISETFVKFGAAIVTPFISKAPRDALIAEISAMESTAKRTGLMEDWKAVDKLKKQLKELDEQTQNTNDNLEDQNLALKASSLQAKIYRLKAKELTTGIVDYNEQIAIATEEITAEYDAKLKANSLSDQMRASIIAERDAKIELARATILNTKSQKENIQIKEIETRLKATEDADLEKYNKRKVEFLDKENEAYETQLELLEYLQNTSNIDLDISKINDFKNKLDNNIFFTSSIKDADIENRMYYKGLIERATETAQFTKKLLQSEQIQYNNVQKSIVRGTHEILSKFQPKDVKWSVDENFSVWATLKQPTLSKIKQKIRNGSLQILQEYKDNIDKIGEKVDDQLKIVLNFENTLPEGNMFRNIYKNIISESSIDGVLNIDTALDKISEYRSLVSNELNNLNSYTESNGENIYSTQYRQQLESVKQQMINIALLLQFKENAAEEGAELDRKRSQDQIMLYISTYSQLASTVLSYTSTITNAIQGYYDVLANNKLKDVSDTQTAEKEKLKFVTMSARRRYEMEKAIDDKALEDEKKIKQQQKKWAIAQALINGALGVTGAWANGGTMASNIVESAVISTATGFQVAAIQAQNFRNSGIVGGASGATEGRDTVTVGARPGEMFLNGRDQRNLMSMIKGNKSTGGQSINIQQGDIVIQGGANQSAIDQIKAETQRFSNLVKETVLDLQYRRQLSFA